MPTSLALGEPVDVPLRGELRYGWELARLSADPLFLRPGRRPNAVPVLLVPGFMAGDSSLATLTGWLRRRGSRTSSAGVRLNVDCGERALGGIEARLQRLAERTGRRVAVVGQSRGGELGRVLAVRRPVLRAVRSVARLGDLGIPGVFSSRCADGECCARFRQDLFAPMPGEIQAVSMYSRSDGIVSWEACLDAGARPIEVSSSHSGMSVNREVYRELAGILDAAEEAS
jgi:triacylglycerol lipase